MRRDKKKNKLKHIRANTGRYSIRELRKDKKVYNVYYRITIYIIMTLLV